MIVTSRYQSCAARSCSAGDQQVTAVVVQHQLDFFTSRRYQLPEKIPLAAIEIEEVRVRYRRQNVLDDDI